MISIRYTNHSDLQYRRMRDERAFNLGGRDPLTSHFEHIVGATTIPEVTIGILIVRITCCNPMAVDRVFRALMFIPVICRCTLTAYHKRAHRSLHDRLPALIDDFRFVARHDLACTAWSYITLPVT